MRIDALADDGLVVPGQPVKVSVIMANRGAADVAVRQVKFEGFDGEGACQPATLRPGSVTRCEPTLKVPAQAHVTEPYWHREGEAGRYTFDSDAPFGLPFRPTPFYVQVTLGIAGPGGPGGGMEEVVDGLRSSTATRGKSLAGKSGSICKSSRPSRSA